MEYNPEKPAKRRIRTFSLKPETLDLIEQVAARYDVSASRVVDTALEQYLEKVMKKPITEKSDGQ